MGIGQYRDGLAVHDGAAAACVPATHRGKTHGADPRAHRRKNRRIHRRFQITSRTRRTTGDALGTG